MVPDGGADRRGAVRARAPTLAVAAGVVALSLDDGTSDVMSRSVAAIVAWWAVLLAVAFSLWPRDRVPRAALACGLPFAGFAAFTGLSALWAPSAERAFLEFDRVALYGALLAVAVLGAVAGEGRRWADGLAIGIAAIGALALAQRLFPAVLPETDIPAFLPDEARRLSYPLGYWNGLGEFLGLGLPLLLRLAGSSAALIWRAAAVVPIPVAASAMYLTSSRGGAAVAIVGALVYLACAPRRFAALQAIAIAAAGSAIAIAVLSAHPALVDGAPGTAAAEAEGPGVAVLIGLISLACGAAYAALAGVLPPRLRLSRPLAAAVAAIALLGSAAAVVVADPAERVRNFKAAPVDMSGNPEFVRSHLLSSAGSGRWQFWGAATDQWREHPVAGQGAGSFEAWWAEHGTIDWFVRNAH
jgi:hypothetical protein